MNVVFLSSMSKKEGERTIFGQVIVFEQQGAWQLVWSMPDDANNEVHECWYEGADQEELTTIYIQRLTEKKGEGFVPIISDLFGSLESKNEETKLVKVLEYYSETHHNTQAFEMLRKWRREQSFKENRSAYMVASNRLLYMVSTFLPVCEEELLQIPGFGQQKASLYGSAIFEITKQFPRETNFPLHWVSGKIEQLEYLQWMEEQKSKRMKEVLERKNRKQQLLDHISKGADISSLQTIMKLGRREIVQKIEELAKEGHPISRLLETELGKLDPKQKDGAFVVFKELGDRYLKPVLSKVFTAEELDQIKTDQAYEWLRLLRLQYRLDNQYRQRSTPV